MKKGLFALCLMMLFLFVGSFSAFAASPVSVAVNGNTLVFTEDEGAPFIDANNRVLVPLRKVMEACGCSVYWDAAANQALVSKDGITVSVPVGRPEIQVNGRTVPTDTMAVLKDGRVCLPIRPVLEAFGFDVEWIADPQLVWVETAASSVPVEEGIWLSSGKWISLEDLSEELDGKDGVSVKDAEIDSDGDLIITLSSGKEINAGSVVSSSAGETYYDHEVGDRFYIPHPDEVTFEDRNGEMHTIEINEMYYELVEIYDYSHAEAWQINYDYFTGRKEATEMQFYPFVFELHFDIQADAALAGTDAYICWTPGVMWYGMFDENGIWVRDEEKMIIQANFGIDVKPHVFRGMVISI